MAKETKIQWCDSTINPIMGCKGCELFPKPETILNGIDQSMKSLLPNRWNEGDAKSIFTEILEETWNSLVEEQKIGHENAVTTTNIQNLRNNYEQKVSKRYSPNAGKEVRQVIESSVTCYAAKLHANRGYSLSNPNKKVNSGYAPTFESLKQFPGRLASAARLSPLSSVPRDLKPWLNGLPRLIFVSDMGDAFSKRNDFKFLESEFEAITSEKGREHLWLWLTKRPEIMKDFAERIGGFPENVCVMTTVTSRKTINRVDSLREVDAHIRGLSLEPLWEQVVDDLDLTGIDWVIIGGESGAKANVRPFPIEWAIELHARCQEQGVAFFLKQLGSKPTRNGEVLNLNDSHGGDWDEWPSGLCTREMPEYFKTFSDKMEAVART